MNLGYQISSDWQCKAHAARGTASNLGLGVMDYFLVGRYGGSQNPCSWDDKRKTRKLLLQTSAGQKRQVPSKQETCSQINGHRLLDSVRVCGNDHGKNDKPPKTISLKVFFSRTVGKVVAKLTPALVFQILVAELTNCILLQGWDWHENPHPKAVALVDLQQETNMKENPLTETWYSVSWFT